MPDNKMAKRKLLTRVAEVMEEVSRSGPHTVSQEWFTLDLTMPQMRAVFLLVQSGPMRMSDLATSLDISLSRATGLIDKLVEKDLVKRWTDPDDRRSVLCNLTDKGLDLVPRLMAQRRFRWEERLAGLSEEELKQVCSAMELVRKASRQTTPEHAGASS